jgi:hypothetical protein
MKTIKIFKYFLFLSLFLPAFSSAEDSICARVKIEIRQEMTLERQAFDAHMRINNGFDSISLENVRVDVNFEDENGKSVIASSDTNNSDALFFIRVDSMDDINNVEGSGTVQPSSSADIHWLIIPAIGASDGLEQGTLYYVGATLTYTIGGEEHVTEVTPDYIFVKPMPELILDYFLPVNVYGDDPFTSQIEPVIPFSLGVRVSNKGFGAAKKLKIDSAQPEIVEKEQGLLIGFLIEGSEVNGEEAIKSLLVDFGDIAPDTAGTARWIMTCSLSGKFVDFQAEYSHSNELGGELTSLIEDIHTHFLVQDVIVDLPGRDDIKDFLAKDGDIYKVYESDNVDTEVTNKSLSSNINGSGKELTLSTKLTKGFLYIQLSDPKNGQMLLKEVIRSDGKQIKQENAWLSKTQEEDHSWKHFFNLFDVDTTDTYTIIYEDISESPVPPVLQFIPDRSRKEGQQLSFIVEASDPNGTSPILSTKDMPAEAIFVDKGNGVGIFDWTPKKGQAGVYKVTFTASDGELSTSKVSIITITSQTDADADGMADDWEIEHFGSLNRDGFGDFDGDGISDYEEYLKGTDPEDADSKLQPPIAEAGPDQKVQSEVSVILDASNSYDMDDAIVSYDWVQTEGTVVLLSAPSSLTTTFISPNVDSNGDSLIFQVTVTDEKGLQSTDSCIINVTWKNTPPIADAGNDLTATAGGIQSITLNASNSSDHEGAIIAYQWIQTDGLVVELNNPSSITSSFQIPDVGENGTSLTFQLTVIDDSGLKSQDTCVVNIVKENIPPSANAGLDQTANEGETVTLNASNSIDSDDGIAFYHWTQIQGPPITLYSATTPKPTFTAPKVDTQGSVLKFHLTVTDNGGLKSHDTCIINVSWINSQPSADAGTDQSVIEGTIVVLDGSKSSDLDDGIASYEWTQTEGTDVVLSYTTTFQPNFTSPEVDAEEVLTFQLTVKDKGGLFSKSYCRVNVKNTSSPPSANAGGDQNIQEGKQVTLDASQSSDLDGTIISYEWIQTQGTIVELSDIHAAMPNFNAPEVDIDGESLTFQVNITDDSGLKAVDTCIVHVFNKSDVNLHPTANAGNDQTINEGTKVILDASASFDQDGNIASYLWTQTDSNDVIVTLSESTSVTSTFIAPDVMSDHVSLEFQLTITDNEGLQSTDKCVIHIVWVKIVPTANAGNDQIVTEGDKVDLNASNSFDPDRGIDSYEWTQVTGPDVTLSDATAVKPYFNAPDVDANGASIEFKLLIQDIDEQESIDYCIVNVIDSSEGNKPPIAHAGLDQVVDEGGTVVLDASDSFDPDNNILSYHWEQIQGSNIILSEPDAITTTFFAPNVCPGVAIFTFRLTVIDNGGLKNQDTCMINISCDNVPPIANAGLDQTFEEGTTVMLDASESTFSDGSNVTYLWSQVRGKSVTLSDPTNPKPSFITPPINIEESTLIFELLIEDTIGLKSADTVNITIKNNGITLFPDNVLPISCSNEKYVGLEINSGGSCTSQINMPASEVSDNTNRPDNLIYGLFDMKFKTDIAGGVINVVFYLPEPAPEGYSWFKYGQNGWYDFKDHIEFSADRKQVMITIIDGGIGDDDGLVNGVIIDPSGLGLMNTNNNGGSNDGGSNDSGGGCFINTVVLESFDYIYLFFFR